MRRGLIVATVLLSSALASPLAQAPSIDAQLERIFRIRDYDPPRFGPARWLPDGTSYTVLERSGGGAPEIVRYDAVTGARSVLVPASHLVPPGGGPPLEIDDYAWSADGRRLLVFTNTRRVWRQNTRGDYWVLDLPDGRLTKLGAGGPESSLMFAKFSPDGTRVAYVRQNDLYVEDLGTGPAASGTAETVRLTLDGSDTTINGTSDWVYEEELGVRDGFRWSPDGTRIAYWQFDTTGVGIFTLINTTDSLYPALTRIPYPKVGTTNSAVRIGVVDARGPSTPFRASGATRWVQTPGDPRDTYLARMEWIGNGEVSIQQLNRLQNRNDFLIASADSGEVRRAFRDESSTWVEVVDEVRWIGGGAAFLWISERNGWRHVYRVPRPALSDVEGAGEDATSITRFDADVIDVAGVDEKGGWLYFIASPGDATRRYLYRSRLDGSGPPARVTPADRPGTHAYTVAPGARLAFHTFSQFDRPPAIDVVDLPAHTSLRKLTDTATLEQKLKTVVEPPVEFFTVGVDDGVMLDGWMLKPASFDASKRYPAIVFVYGEPAGQTVTDRWGGHRALFHRALANAGYVVLSVDNRGTPAPKGAAWRKVVYGSVGDLSSKEQAAAIGALTKRHAFLDPDRVGIWGWSGGGTNTLNALFRFPDLYKVGVSVAPVPDQQLYDTIYQERYMGLPKDNADGYRRGSAINFADGLKGRLLLVHGSGDDNVHYQGTERLVNTLVALGKPFDLMVYPNRSHAISEGAGTTLHVHTLVARHFLEHLAPGPR